MRLLFLLFLEHTLVEFSSQCCEFFLLFVVRRLDFPLWLGRVCQTIRSCGPPWLALYSMQELEFMFAFCCSFMCLLCDSLSSGKIPPSIIDVGLDICSGLQRDRFPVMLKRNTLHFDLLCQRRFLVDVIFLAAFLNRILLTQSQIYFSFLISLVVRLRSWSMLCCRCW